MTGESNVFASLIGPSNSCNLRSRIKDKHDLFNQLEASTLYFQPIRSTHVLCSTNQHTLFSTNENRNSFPALGAGNSFIIFNLRALLVFYIT